MEKSRQMSLPRFAIVVPVSLALAFGFSACENVATYTQPSLVRFIDASYKAPAADVAVEGELLAANVGAGTITSYGTVPADSAALIEITAATGSTSLATTNGTLLPGRQNSVFLADNASATNGYTVAVLADQALPAASGHSAFRFLNQAPKTGAVDIYMVPAGTTLANSTPLVTDLAVGGAAGYTSFTSQTVTMVITPTGKTTPQYTSTPITLVGGEVRTVLIMDTQLTSNPPVQATMADDAGPAD
jgi:hypothetical protein